MKKVPAVRTYTKKEVEKMGPKRFILDVLIPFVRRDQGRGFAMDVWMDSLDTDYGIADATKEVPDRIPPVCGTVACIGGSVSVLLRHNYGEHDMCNFLGLAYDQADGLYHGWQVDDDDKTLSEGLYIWPADLREKYKQAQTTEGKAKVACTLLTRIANKGARALELVRHD